MTDDEWDTISLILENTFRGEFSDKRAAAYRLMLNRHDADDVMLALRVLLEEGKPFIPTVGEIFAAMRQRERAAIPSFEEAWAAIRKAIHRLPTSGGEQAELDRLADTHSLVAWFAERQGLRRLARLPVNDPQYGELELKRLREAWDEHVVTARLRGEVDRALAGAERLGLRKVDAAGLLGEGPS